MLFKVQQTIKEAELMSRAVFLPAFGTLDVWGFAWLVSERVCVRCKCKADSLTTDYSGLLLSRGTSVMNAFSISLSLSVSEAEAVSCLRVWDHWPCESHSAEALFRHNPLSVTRSVRLRSTGPSTAHALLTLPNGVTVSVGHMTLTSREEWWGNTAHEAMDQIPSCLSPLSSSHRGWRE